MSAPPVGLTRNAGWEVGARKTLPVSPERAWELLVTQPGLGIWLGHDPDFVAEKGYRLRTSEGTLGEIRSAEEGQLVRLTWRPSDMAYESTLQVRVRPARTGTSISFHHERLASATDRERMGDRWRGALGELERLVLSRSMR